MRKQSIKVIVKKKTEQPVDKTEDSAKNDKGGSDAN